MLHSMSLLLSVCATGVTERDDFKWCGAKSHELYCHVSKLHLYLLFFLDICSDCGSIVLPIVCTSCDVEYGIYVYLCIVSLSCMSCKASLNLCQVGIASFCSSLPLFLMEINWNWNTKTLKTSVTQQYKHGIDKARLSIQLPVVTDCVHVRWKQLQEVAQRERKNEDLTVPVSHFRTKCYC